MEMNHPLAKGTKVIAAYHSCPTCGPSRIQKISTRILKSDKKSGEWFYTLLDGREVSQTDIIEVR